MLGHHCCNQASVDVGVEGEPCAMCVLKYAPMGQLSQSFAQCMPESIPPSAHAQAAPPHSARVSHCLLVSSRGRGRGGCHARRLVADPLKRLHHDLHKNVMQPWQTGDVYHHARNQAPAATNTRVVISAAETALSSHEAHSRQSRWASLGDASLPSSDWCHTWKTTTSKQHRPRATWSKATQRARESGSRQGKG